MQVAVPASPRSHRVVLQHRAVVFCTAFCLAGASVLPARAASGALPVDTAVIASLQLRAQQASPREQVQLYADLVDKISLLASREIADGELDKAEATLHQLESCTAQIESGLQRDSKNLKRTEMLLHDTHRRLTDLVRSASGDMKPMVQSAVAHLEHVQTALLSAVFEH